jgi:hypothetical protein
MPAFGKMEKNKSMKYPNEIEYINLMEIILLIDRILFHDFDEVSAEADVKKD